MVGRLPTPVVLGRFPGRACGVCGGASAAVVVVVVVVVVLVVFGGGGAAAALLGSLPGALSSVAGVASDLLSCVSIDDPL